MDANRPDANDPLSLDKGSSWFKYFNNQAELDMIRKDVARTEIFYECDKESAHKMMETLLLVWSLENPQINYRQGMNDLVSFIMLALRVDLKNPMKDIMEACFFEADTYTLFDKLMETAIPWFTPGAAAMGEQQTPLFKKFQNIQNSLLKKADPALWEHLVAKDIAPQLYLLRWIRLLFAREFEPSQVLIVWDAIMEDMELVDYICVAMLSYIRFELMNADATGVLQRLLHYPATDNVQSILTLAQHFKDGGDIAHDMTIKGPGGRQHPVPKLKGKERKSIITLEEIAHILGPMPPHYRVKKQQGYLVKRGEARNFLGRHSFKKRWFVYKDGELCYSKSPEHGLRAMIDMTARVVTVFDPALFCFHISPIRKASERRSHSSNQEAEQEHTGDVVDGFAREGVRRDHKPRRVYELYAPNYAAMEDWVAILNAAHEIRLTSFD